MLTTLTKTTTKSITNTKLLIATLVALLAGGVAFLVSPPLKDNIAESLSVLESIFEGRFKINTNLNAKLNTELNCQDNKDDDNDGKFDCFDTDCQKCDDNNADTIDYCSESCQHIDLNKEIGVKPSEIICAKVFSGSDTSGTKIPIVFVADGYATQDSFDSKIVYGDFDPPNLYGMPKNRNIKGFDLSVQQELDKNGIGLFGLEPYKTNKEKFDVYTLKSAISWGCGEAGSNIQSKNCPQETIRKIIKAECQIYNVQPYIVALNINNYVGLGMGSFTYAMGNAFTHVAHEFGGHSFVGYLWDEYNKSIGGNVYFTYSNANNYGDAGCTNWCGSIDKNSACYSHYQTYQNCLKTNTFNYCFKQASNNYYNATGKGFKSDCNIGKNCLGSTGCYFGVNLYRQMNNDVLRWHWYGAGFKMPTISDDVYYKKLTTITDNNVKKTIILNPSFPIESNYYFDNDLDPLENDWWTVRWDHLDVEGCPKWCAGLDTKSQCYPYYQEFKQCAENKLKTTTSTFTQANDCWQQVSAKYKNSTGKNLVDGCALGLNCKNNAQCVWPGGGLVYPYATFRKNIAMPYWGYGAYSEKIIKDTIDTLFAKQNRLYVNIEAIKKSDPKICFQLHEDHLSDCLFNISKTLSKPADCALLNLNINKKICATDNNLMLKCTDYPQYNTKISEYCYYQVAVKNNDSSLCAKSALNKNLCYEEIGIKTNDIRKCALISASNPGEKDTCIWTIIGQTKNIKDCATNQIYPTSQDSCKSLVALTAGKIGKITDCKNLPERKYQEECYIEVAGVNKDIKICDNNISDAYNKKACYQKVAKATGDFKLCDKAEKIASAGMVLAGGGLTYTNLDWCYIEAAKTSGNISICQKLSYKSGCINEVAKAKKDSSYCDKIGSGDIHNVASCKLGVELEKNK
ncbi:MAG: hypothetical protein COU31_03750 [Candidatus Magasanikbacteria bacterium CG10_big_fil_rev_8_21_14_0_10_40_10]|uniref:Uncharacterized protein n=1 Tax=Candidatus Magasanikbacteria bacterium CG10_big_fil_rev_8_21_14_0_10_40_10 TaxID=1974648 RepID=A0A2M6W3A3_9BACT|nr:MAG: hypothetical protein COU31_03750 [Candidatus Magasanikbacteria bacterium CG10_big_fil_rev_8_21_14_0_10_40_10]